jgi:hypothetical protein
LLSALLLVMSSNSGYLTAERGQRALEQRLAAVRSSEGTSVDAADKVTVQQAVLLVNSWCCVVQVIL